MKNLLELIKDRRSIRSFKETKGISKRMLDEILEAAKWAPSARNLQPLEFIIVRDKKIRLELARACSQEQPITGEFCLVVVGDEMRAAKVGEVSPHDITTAEKGLTNFLYQDAAAATQNMILLAYSMGIDSLWISSFDEPAVRRILEISSNFRPINIIVFGYRQKGAGVPPKRHIKDRLHHEKFKTLKHDESYLEFSKILNSPSDNKRLKSKKK